MEDLKLQPWEDQGAQDARGADKVAVAAVISDYGFGTETTFLNANLIGKLNTKLRDKTVSVEHKDMFELSRGIARLSTPY